MKTKILIIKGIIISIAVILFGWYSLPFIYIGLLNLGNISGMIITVLIIFITLFSEKILSYLKKFFRKTIGKMICIFVSLILLSGIIFSSFIVVNIISHENKGYKQGNMTVIVLGCQVNGTAPSAMLYERIKSAYEVLLENPEAVCIASGGMAGKEQISEAQCIYNELVKMGIDKNRIYLEDKSTNTAENIEFSYDIIKSNSLSKNITISTDGFHQYRAYLLAKRYDFDYIGSTSAKPLLYMSLTYYTREIFAVAKELI